MDWIQPTELGASAAFWWQWASSMQQQCHCWGEEGALAADVAAWARLERDHAELRSVKEAPDSQDVAEPGLNGKK